MITGYDLHLNKAYDDPDTRGVGIYIKQRLNATVVENHLSTLFKDSLWLHVPGIHNQNLLIGCIYRSGSPAKASQLDPELHTMIKHMSSEAGYNQVLIMGDFNHPHILWTPSPVISTNHTNPNHPDVQFIETLNEAMLHQHISKPTRDRENQTPTIDDLILTTDPDAVNDIQHIGHLGGSDHLCLTFTVNHIHKKAKPVQQTRFKYHKADMTKMKEKLDIDWNSELHGKTAEEGFNLFLHKYNAACEECIPKETTTHSDKYVKPIWMKPATMRMIKRKHHLHNKLLNTLSDDIKAEYHQIRNQVTKNTRYDRMTFERNISKEIKNNNKLFWRYVNANRKSKAEIPDLERKDGTKATTDYEKAEELNQQFSSVFTREDTETLPEFEALNIPSPLSSINITPEKVQKKLNKLRTDKSAGPDGVHPLMLKNLSSILCNPLCTIFNISLQSGLVPSLWKQGTVTAIYKKGKKSLASNYRAITLTSIICKLLEDLITECIKEHLILNNKQDHCQHGFTSHKSTVTNLIEALNLWTEALSHGLPVDIVYLDFEKAFDKVPHERLLLQLYKYGIRGDILAWIKDYLHNRSQKVRVNGVHSSTAPVLSGVPQGSIIGPALFLIFVADSSSLVRNFISLYADDTKLFSYLLEAASAEDKYTPLSIQKDLNTLAIYCDTMQMSYNVDKCHVLHLGKQNNHYNYSLPKMSNIKKTASSISYDYTFHNLEAVQQEKDLGVIIDHQLKFRNHINEKVKKANSLIFLIKHTFKYLNSEMFNLLYKSIVRPHLEYASPAWSPTLKIDINSIEKVQRRATRLVPALSSLSYNERLQELKLPTLQYRRLRTDLILIYKLTHNLTTLDTNTHCKKCHLKNMLTPSLSSTTRGHNLKFQIQHHQGIRNSFFTTRCLSTWNNLRPNTVNAKSLNLFKNYLSNDLSMPQKYLYTQ